MCSRCSAGRRARRPPGKVGAKSLAAAAREEAAKFVDGMLAPVYSEALRAEIRATMLAAPQHVAVGAMEGIIDEAIWKEDEITAPVLAVLARSPFWPADNEQRYRQIAPDLDYQMWDGVSHFLMLDKPDEFNRALADFIAQRKLSTRKLRSEKTVLVPNSVPLSAG